MIGKKTVGIVGAGISGLAQAHFLIQAGFDVKIFEQTEQLRPRGAGLMLAPNALCLLKDLPNYHSVLAKSFQIENIGIMHQKHLSMKIKYSKMANKLGVPWISLTRSNLHQGLLQGLEKNLYLGKCVEAIKQGKRGVELSFSDKSSVAVDFCVAADGINSKLRQMLFPGNQKRYLAYDAYVSLSHPSGYQMPFGLDFCEILSNGSHFGIVKLAQNQIYFFCAVDQGYLLPDDFEGSRTFMLRHFQNIRAWTEPLINTMDKNHFFKWKICDLPYYQRWYDKRLVFIGDAIHAITPNLGQGASQGIESAYVYAKMLQKYPYEKAFQYYQTKRQKRMRIIRYISFLYGYLFQHAHPLIQFLLRLLLLTQNKLPNFIKALPLWILFKSGPKFSERGLKTD